MNYIEIEKNIRIKLHEFRTYTPGDNVINIYAVVVYCLYKNFEVLKKSRERGSRATHDFFEAFFDQHEEKISQQVKSSFEYSDLDKQINGLIDVMIEYYEHCSNASIFGRQSFEQLQEWLDDNPAHVTQVTHTPRIINDLYHALIGDCSDMVLYDGVCGLGALAFTLKPKKAILRDGNKFSTEPGKLLLEVVELDVDIKYEEVLYDSEPNPQADLVVCVPTFDTSYRSVVWHKVENPKYLLGSMRHKAVPTNASDSLWIQQALSQLNTVGKAYVLVNPGWLFRGGYDRELREYLLEQDLIQAVVHLPAGLLKTTRIETALLIINKAKKLDIGKVRLVDARDFGKRRRTVTKLERSAISKIENLVNGNDDSLFGSQYCQILTLQQIKEKDYSLSYGEYAAAEIKVTKLSLEEELLKLSNAQADYEASQSAFNELLNKI